MQATRRSAVVALVLLASCAKTADDAAEAKHTVEAMLGAGEAFQAAYWLNSQARAEFVDVRSKEFLEVGDTKELDFRRASLLNDAARQASADILEEASAPLRDARGRPIPEDDNPAGWDCLKRVQVFVDELNTTASTKDKELERWMEVGGTFVAVNGETYTSPSGAAVLRYRVAHSVDGLHTTKEWAFRMVRQGQEWKIVDAIDTGKPRDKHRIAEVAKELRDNLLTPPPCLSSGSLVAEEKGPSSADLAVDALARAVGGREVFDRAVFGAPRELPAALLSENDPLGGALRERAELYLRSLTEESSHGLARLIAKEDQATVVPTIERLFANFGFRSTMITKVDLRNHMTSAVHWTGSIYDGTDFYTIEGDSYWSWRDGEWWFDPIPENLQAPPMASNDDAVPIREGDRAPSREILETFLQAWSSRSSSLEDLLRDVPKSSVDAIMSRRLVKWQVDDASAAATYAAVDLRALAATYRNCAHRLQGSAGTENLAKRLDGLGRAVDADIAKIRSLESMRYPAWRCRLTMATGDESWVIGTRPHKGKWEVSFWRPPRFDAQWAQGVDASVNLGLLAKPPQAFDLRDIYRQRGTFGYDEIEKTPVDLTR